MGTNFSFRFGKMAYPSPLAGIRPRRVHPRRALAIILAMLMLIILLLAGASRMPIGRSPDAEFLVQLRATSRPSSFTTGVRLSYVSFRSISFRNNGTGSVSPPPLRASILRDTILLLDHLHPGKNSCIR